MILIAYVSKILTLQQIFKNILAYVEAQNLHFSTASSVCSNSTPCKIQTVDLGK